MVLNEKIKPFFVLIFLLNKKRLCFLYSAGSYKKWVYKIFRISYYMMPFPGTEKYPGHKISRVSTVDGSVDKKMV